MPFSAVARRRLHGHAIAQAGEPVELPLQVGDGRWMVPGDDPGHLERDLQGPVAGRCEALDQPTA